MKVSLNWLSEYIDLTLDPASLSQLLTMTGVEVEGIEAFGGNFPLVVVAQILSAEPHPNADRLSVCSVDDGSGTPRQIVCGAKNYKPGDKVPLALPGSELPGDFKIKKGKLRGVESDGMLCSATELNLARESEGLLILPPDAPIGTPVHNLYPQDTIFDLEITPNRGDLLSHLGLARELSALTNKPLISPELSQAPTNGESPQVNVQVLDATLCPLYTARLIRGVKVGPSPDWLVRRLEAVGLRTINNIVDITNYVLLETGQPLHAFDAAHVKQGITVRLSEVGGTFRALDGQSYSLDAKDLVIADAEKVLALAGVMGGEDSSVTGSTTEVILESAQFLPSTVRHSSRRHGLISDSSYRFERGVNAAGVEQASRRAIDLILELAGGEAQPQITVVSTTSAPVVRVTLRADRCRKLLGAPVTDEEIADILMRFGLNRVGNGDDFSEWQIPSHRLDLTREVDLIEEVARVYGLERIPPGKGFTAATESVEDRAYAYRMRLRRILQGTGFCEARTLTLLSESSLCDHVTGSHEPLRVRNPLGEDSAALRPGLMPGLLRAVSFNVRQGAENVRLFELGRVFRNAKIEEPTMLGLVMTGDTTPGGWHDKSTREATFFDLKGILSTLSPAPLDLRRIELPGLAVAVEIFSGDTALGTAGQIWPKRARELDIRTAVFVAELDVAALQELSDQPMQFKPLPRFPSMRRDVAMLVSTEVTHREVETLLIGAKEPLLATVELFDIFTDPSGEKVPSGLKSVAYALTYRSAERTLTSDEVTEAHTRLKERLQTRLGAQFRE